MPVVDKYKVIAYRFPNYAVILRPSAEGTTAYSRVILNTLFSI